ncbi:acylneuraminate cytidylyltransferase family protein [Lysinibacillus telephonicus]|uniref:acylneuraminate cytidylyltransferase family protein n=1 Tax=Lysinibacillus telephonicus TaxID=1714840 RepID=UPI0039796FDC
MNHRILAIIPARGGSKGVPRKNIRDLAGKPLIAWTIEEAKKSKYITKLILSSEDEEIIKVAKEYGCEVPYVRPLELAKDDTPGIDPIIHALQQHHDFDYVVLLQPTSPLRTVEDIDRCISFIIENNADFCVSVTESEESPYWMYTFENGKMKPLLKQDQVITRRQELPKTYVLNGAVYVGKVDSIMETKSFLTDQTIPYVMPMERSYDIDTLLDFTICEFIMQKRVNE